MMYLENDSLRIQFPNLHPNAGIEISFQRTLRLPDNDQVHHLPPSLGRFPLRHIADYDLQEHDHLKKRGGLLMPMYQADALWMSFSSLDMERGPAYPIALKISTGKTCTVSGENWSETLNRDPQDYLVIPDQPWLDGYNVGDDIVRQFVAAPLGQGYTVAEQINPTDATGGIQIKAFPMKLEYYQRLIRAQKQMNYHMSECEVHKVSEKVEMGLGAGGTMRQKIYEDDYDFDVWDLRNSERCFITIANAVDWIEITGEIPPHSPLSASDYTDAGLPWFDIFDGDQAAIKGAEKLGKIKSIKNVVPKPAENFWPEDEPVKGAKVKTLGQKVISNGSW